MLLSEFHAQQFNWQYSIIVQIDSACLVERKHDFPTSRRAGMVFYLLHTPTIGIQIEVDYPSFSLSLSQAKHQSPKIIYKYYRYRPIN